MHKWAAAFDRKDLLYLANRVVGIAVNLDEGSSHNEDETVALTSYLNTRVSMNEQLYTIERYRRSRIRYAQPFTCILFSPQVRAHQRAHLDR